jgi:lipoteichoic acid synthase
MDYLKRIPFPTRHIGRVLSSAVTPASISTSFFLLFVFADAVKTAAFNRLLIDLPAFASFHEFFRGFLGKFLCVFMVYLVLARLKRRYWFAGFYCLQLAYMFVNLSYHFNLMGYLHVGQYTGLFSEGLDLLLHAAIPHDARLWLVAADAPFLILTLSLYGEFHSFNGRTLFRPALFVSAAGMLVAVSRWDPMNFSPKQAMYNAYESDASVVGKHGLLVFNLVDLFNYGDARRHIRALGYGPEISAAETKPVHPDIVALQVESLDAYIIDAKYRGKFVAPFLHELSRKSVYYPFMLSYHEAGSTSDCEFSTLNSVEPFDDFPSIKIRNYDYPNSVLKRFSSQGYRVEAFHGNRGTYFNRSVAFKKMGFDAFRDMFAMGLREVTWGAPDGEVLDFVQGRIASQPEPFFHYIITMSSHEPFTLVRPFYGNKDFDGIKNESTRDYFNVISYVDRELKRFISEVRAARPNAFFFVYGDHTPVIRKDIYKRASFMADGFVFEFVPLLVVTPDSTVYRETSGAATFLDVAPTMLAAAGIPYTLRTAGTNLLNFPLANGAVFYRGNAYSRAELYRRVNRGR